VRIVPAFDEAEDGEPGLGLSPEAPPIDELAFHGGEETLGQSVVVGITDRPSGRARPRPMSSRDIRAIRQQLNASPAVFARFLDVSTQLVQAWGGRQASIRGGRAPTS
jgi:hypothetical protein